MFGALRHGKTDEDKMDTSVAAPVKTLPYKPAQTKVPSLTKSASIVSLKKSSSIHSDKTSKPKTKRCKRMTAAERKQFKLLQKSKVSTNTCTLIYFTILQR